MTKTERALEVLKTGGFFRHALEENYFGNAKFVHRLYDKDRKKVKGIGVKTFFELEKTLSIRPTLSSSSWATEYVYEGT